MERMTAAVPGRLQRPLSFDLGLPAGTWNVEAALALEAGEIVVLTGPLGSGKTTLLRCLAGLVRPQKGHIQAGSTALYDYHQQIDLPPWRRPLGVCLQGDTLFPHLSVAGNLRFGLRSRKAWADRVQPWVEAFGLGDLLGRLPGQLSGGQRQKVQLARTLALDAQVLLLDEPFGVLDPDSHGAVARTLAEHIRASGRCALVVSHSPGDVEALGAFEARLRNGWLGMAQPSLQVLP